MVRGVLIFIIRLYRWVISPVKQSLFGPFGRCRFTPSCSAYAIEALKIHGLWHGSILALKRLLRCHPWGGCGWDPVPGSDIAQLEKAGCQQKITDAPEPDSHGVSLDHRLRHQLARIGD